MGASALQQHAASFLSRVGTTYGDIVLTEFDDPVLQEHVDSIALCDTKVDHDTLYISKHLAHAQYEMSMLNVHTPAATSVITVDEK